MPVSGLSSLARIYADDTEKEETNTKLAAEDADGASSSVVDKTSVAVRSQYEFHLHMKFSRLKLHVKSIASGSCMNALK